MSLVSEIVEGAFREAGLTNELQSATPTQTNQARDRLQAVVSSAYGLEVGEPLTDWPIGLEGIHQPENFCWDQQRWQYPRINVRLVAASNDAQTVYLPARPYDGSRVAVIDPASRLAAAPLTIDGNGRAIEGAQTFTANVNALTKIWFYRGDLGNWVALTPLVLNGEFPFPPEFDDYFITRLAMRLNPRYGRSMTQESLSELERTLGMVRSRYAQSENVGVSPALLNLGEQYSGTGRDSRVYFNGDRGWMG